MTILGKLLESKLTTIYYKIQIFFYTIIALITSHFSFASEPLHDEDILDKKSYYNVYNFDDINSKDFEPAPFVGVSGGWGQATAGSPSGIVFTTVGYRFTKSFGAEFGYAAAISKQYSTTLVNNNYMGILKYYYKINNYLNLSAGVGAGLSHNNILNIDNANNAPESYLNSDNSQTGFVIFPISLGTPVKFIDNLSVGVNYIYVRNFNNTSVNIVTTGLIYSFL
ncbi:outer membrane beta-barrel protein [Francisella sp. SYW-2]|uniref:outer membrane beta-barrel protein n=1 Tax=Francisella sp. SYW-2 TaxID=2610886 RepID=UPI00123DC65E|nr:outer membrane beta-barrel protein [Francisella sp. SYW-2]